VKVATRKICDPLEEDAFRPILHHYDGPKFRLELSVPEVSCLLTYTNGDDTKKKKSIFARTEMTMGMLMDAGAIAARYLRGESFCLSVMS